MSLFHICISTEFESWIETVLAQCISNVLILFQYDSNVQGDFFNGTPPQRETFGLHVEIAQLFKMCTY